MYCVLRAIPGCWSLRVDKDHRKDRCVDGHEAFLDHQRCCTVSEPGFQVADFVGLLLKQMFRNFFKKVLIVQYYWQNWQLKMVVGIVFKHSVRVKWSAYQCSKKKNLFLLFVKCWILFLYVKRLEECFSFLLLSFMYNNETLFHSGWLVSFLMASWLAVLCGILLWYMF